MVCVDTRSTEDGLLLQAMAAKAPVQMLEFGLSTFLHEDVRRGCPDIPSKAQVRPGNE